MNKSKCIWYFTSILYRLKTSSTSFQSSVALWYYNWLLLGVAKQHYLSLWRHCIGVHANVRALFDWIKESGKLYQCFKDDLSKIAKISYYFPFLCLSGFFRQKTFVPMEGKRRRFLKKPLMCYVAGWTIIAPVRTPHGKPKLRLRTSQDLQSCRQVFKM